MNMNLTKNVLISEVLAPVSAGASIDSNSDILDMMGWDGVVFIVPITDCVSGGVATLNAQGSAANSDTAMTTLTGASATVTSSGNDNENGTLLIVDVYRPLLRYIQGNVTSASQNIAYGNMIAIRYSGRKFPITDHATVSDATFVTGV